MSAIKKYEYRDHTSDIQLHSWGSDFQEAVEQLVLSMYNYMTDDLEKVEPIYSMEFQAEGEDKASLVYNLLQECLYNFTTEPFFTAKTVKVQKFDHESSKISIFCEGESFDLKKHSPGTEIKAITYSALQIVETESRVDIYVVVDI